MLRTLLSTSKYLRWHLIRIKLKSLFLNGHFHFSTFSSKTAPSFRNLFVLLEKNLLLNYGLLVFYLMYALFYNVFLSCQICNLFHWKLEADHQLPPISLEKMPRWGAGSIQLDLSLETSSNNTTFLRVQIDKLSFWISQKWFQLSGSFDRFISPLVSKGPSSVHGVVVFHCRDAVWTSRLYRAWDEWS